MCSINRIKSRKHDVKEFEIEAKSDLREKRSRRRERSGGINILLG